MKITPEERDRTHQAVVDCLRDLRQQIADSTLPADIIIHKRIADELNRWRVEQSGYALQAMRRESSP